MIYYINNYYDEENEINRIPISSPAMNNKIAYFHNVFKEDKIDYVNVSFGFTKTKGFTKSYEKQNEVYLSTLNFSEDNKYSLIGSIYLHLALSVYYIKNIRKKDTVMLYHHPWLALLICFFQLILGFKLVLEIEELCFLDDSKSLFKRRVYRVLEDALIRRSQSYIVVNKNVKEYLIDNYRIDESNILVCYGNYSVVKNHNPTKCVGVDEKIKILYSGSIDEARGAFKVFELASLIDAKRYKIYVSGYGKNDVVKRFRNMVEKSNANSENCRIVFKGELKLDSYYSLLAKADICINFQQDENQFARYSFPSKIINYYAFTNIVCSTKMSAVINSPFSELISFFEYNNIKGLSEKIEQIELNTKNNGYELINSLNQDFLYAIKKVICEG